MKFLIIESIIIVALLGLLIFTNTPEAMGLWALLFIKNVLGWKNND